MNALLVQYGVHVIVALVSSLASLAGAYFVVGRQLSFIQGQLSQLLGHGVEVKQHAVKLEVHGLRLEKHDFDLREAHAKIRAIVKSSPPTSLHPKG